MRIKKLYNCPVFLIRKPVLSFIFMLLCFSLPAQIRLETPNVESILYLGKGRNQPLIVGLGGSEGGNAWTSDYWKDTRDSFLNEGYAFLAIGYFGAPGTPEILNQIAIEDVYHAIKSATGQKRINQNKIAIIGGSRGADLALLLASHYSDIDCVVSIVGSSSVFPGHTDHFSTSCFTYGKQDLPFVPVNAAAVPFLMARNLRGCFEAMLSDTVAANKAAIPVEHISGPILFMSATKDEVCPSTPMANMMMDRLRSNNFTYYSEHKVYEGGHTEPLKHFDDVFSFLDAQFGKKNKQKNKQQSHQSGS